MATPPPAATAVSADSWTPEFESARNFFFDAVRDAHEQYQKTGDPRSGTLFASIPQMMGLPDYVSPSELNPTFGLGPREQYIQGIYLGGLSPEAAAARADEWAQTTYGIQQKGQLIGQLIDSGNPNNIKAAVQAGIIEPAQGANILETMAANAGTPMQKGMVPGYEVQPDGNIAYTGAGGTPYSIIGDPTVELGTVDTLNPVSGQFKTQIVDNRTRSDFDMFKSAAGMLAGAAGAAGFGPAAFLTEMGMPAIAANMVSGVGTGMLSGADFEEALRGAIMSQGIGFGADALAPYLNDILAGLKNSVGEVGLSAYTFDDILAPGEIKKPGASFQVADASGDLTGLVDGQEMFSPNSYMNQPGFVNAGSLDEALQNSVSPVYGDLAEGVTYAPGMFSGYDATTGQATFNGGGATMPAATPEADPTFGGELEETAPGTFEQPPAPDPSAITGADLKRYASIAQKVYSLFGGEEKALAGAPRPPTRPQPTEEGGEVIPEQEAQYQEEEKAFLEQAASYLGLDLVAMDEAGLVPGTPEYLAYILDQADSVIAQVLGDADPESEEFATQFRAKSEKEQIQLMRALYIRGQLGALSGSGTYTDPFTGAEEDVALPDGVRVRPTVAAHQRGLARSVDELAKMSPQEAKRFLGGMLSRDPDLFRMQARRDATGLREALEPLETEEMRRKRRGMFGDSAFFQQELGGMGGADLDALLTRLIGRDEGRRGAAVAELFGWQPEEI